MAWGKIEKQEIQSRVFAALRKNKNYRTTTVLGLPASYLDAEVFPPDADFLKDAPFAKAFMENPNHIGCHTLVGGESAFEGTHALERELLEICAVDMFGASSHAYDGYVASGGTEANIQALWTNRNYFMEEYGLEAQHIAVLYSADSHYSFYKGSNLLQIQAIEVPVEETTRQMTHATYDRALQEAQSRGVRAIIAIFNMGTTMFGSVDAIDEYIPILKRSGMPYKVHVDGAFGGFVYPFVDTDLRLTFKNQEVGSITIDAHKMLQAPYGTGIFLCRKGMINYTHTGAASYVVGGDATLVGSRSGANLIAAWMILQTYGHDGWKQKVLQLIARTDMLCAALRELGIAFYRNEGMNLVTMHASQIPESLIEKYVLVPDAHDDSARWVKIVVMDHVKNEHIDAFIADLKAHLTTAAYQDQTY
ncbi:MAG: aspartate aminotransferase family protein [Sphingobacteriaceae bacterium]|nr:aspartate aminotransferase family protein [Sphingobacteriaceae bacterium]